MVLSFFGIKKLKKREAILDNIFKAKARQSFNWRTVALAKSGFE
jgi:hypothetical protein